MVVLTSTVEGLEADAGGLAVVVVEELEVVDEEVVLGEATVVGVVVELDDATVVGVVVVLDDVAVVEDVLVEVVAWGVTSGAAALAGGVPFALAAGV